MDGLFSVILEIRSPHVFVRIGLFVKIDHHSSDKARQEELRSYIPVMVTIRMSQTHSCRGA